MRFRRVDQNSATPIDAFQRLTHFHAMYSENNDVALGCLFPGPSDGAGTKISDKMSQCRRTVGTIRLAFIPTASFQILPRLLEKIRSTLPLVKVELREGSENPQITGLRSGTFDVCIGHLSPTYDQIENMLLIRERLVVALPKGHRAARKKNVGLRDLEGEPSSCPRKICCQACIK